MFEITKNKTTCLPVVLKQNDGTPKIGVVNSSITLSIIKADGTQLDILVSASLWTEMTATAYSRQGYYNYVMTGSLLDQTGTFQYCAFISGSAPYFGVVKITDGDSGAIYNRIGAPISGTISDDIQNIPSAAASGGFGATDRAMLSATWHTSSLLPADPASNTAVSGYIHVIDQNTNISNILTQVNNLPADPLGIANYNAGLTAAYGTINTNTTNGFTQIKGLGWNTNHTLQIIATSATYVATNGATQAFLSYTFVTITGNGFTTGQDDLHALSVGIQGITPGSGGGGFSTTDRTMLQSAYSQTLPLPTDPASNTFISATMFAQAGRMMGSGAYGSNTGTTIYQVAQDTNAIRTKTAFIPNATVASSANLSSAYWDLAGIGFVSVSNSLYAISTAASASNFTSQDRTNIQQISASVGLGLSGTVNSVKNDTANIYSKTSLLPNDVVGQSWMYPYLATIISASAISGGFSTGDRNNINYISQTLGKPQGSTVSADILGIINTQASDETKINQIYTKTNALPVDPVSTTYLTQVSQSLGSAILISSGSISVAVTNSFNALNAKLGTPANGTVSADIAAVNIQATNAYTAASNADTHAQQATTQATTAAAGTTNIINVLGTPMSGTVSADILATYRAALSVSSTLSGSFSASVDLSPVLRVLGKPVTTVSEDIKQVAALVKSKK